MLGEKIKDLIDFVRQQYSGSSTGVEDTIAYLKEQNITRMEAFIILLYGLKVSDVEVDKIILDNNIGTFERVEVTLENREGTFIDRTKDFEEACYYDRLLRDEYGDIIDLLSPPFN